MQIVSDSVRALLDAYAKVVLSVYIDGEKLAVGIGISTYSGSCAGDDEFSFGNACAAGMIIGLAKTIHGLKGRRIVVKWSVDDTEYPLLSGQIANYKVTAGRTEVEAWDDMYFAGSKAFEMTEDVASDCDAATAFAAVAIAMGVEAEQESLDLLAGLPIPGGLSGLSSDVTNSAVAGYIAGLVGGNALMSREGQLCIRQYAECGWETEPYSGGAGADNEDFSITGVTLQRAKNVVKNNSDGTSTEHTETSEYSSGDGSLMISNPLASQNAADRAYAALQAIKVRPGNYSFPGGLLLEPGDIFMVHSMDGSYAVAVGSISMDFDGGVKSSVSCGGEGENGGLKGVIHKTLQALILDFAKFKKLEAENATIVRAIIDELYVNDLHAEVIHLLTDKNGFFTFYSWDELNEFVETMAQKMVANSQKRFGVTIEIDPIYSYGILTLSSGLDTDAMPCLLATLEVDGKKLYRQASASGKDETGGWNFYWHYGDGGEDGGNWSLFGAAYAKQVAGARNLLDNSDFTNPVNQRNAASYDSTGSTGWTFTVDRWKAECAKLTVNDGYVNFTTAKSTNYKRMVQLLNRKMKVGEQYTVAMLARVNEVGNHLLWRPCTSAYSSLAGSPGLSIAEATGVFELYVLSFEVRETLENPGIDFLCLNTADDYADIDVAWVALYEGVYTKETLPEYRPKGYGAELAECLRYAISLGGVFRYKPCQITPDVIEFAIPVPQPLQDVPKFDAGALTLYGMSGSTLTTPSGFTFSIVQNGMNGFVIRATKSGHGLTDAMLSIAEGTIFSADL